jgi:hypothetical protein
MLQPLAKQCFDCIGAWRTGWAKAGFPHDRGCRNQRGAQIGNQLLKPPARRIGSERSCRGQQEAKESSKEAEMGSGESSKAADVYISFSEFSTGSAM